MFLSVGRDMTLFVDRKTLTDLFSLVVGGFGAVARFSFHHFVKTGSMILLAFPLNPVIVRDGSATHRAMPHDKN
jgi:hypothetical protein